MLAVLRRSRSVGARRSGDRRVQPDHTDVRRLVPERSSRGVDAAPGLHAPGQPVAHQLQQRLPGFRRGDRRGCRFRYFDAGLFAVDIADPFGARRRSGYRRDRAFEGNALDVSFATAGGRQLRSWARTTGSPRARASDQRSSVAGSKFACEAMFTLFDPEDTAQVYRRPGGQLPATSCVGRACPGDVLPGNPDVDPARSPSATASRMAPAASIRSGHRVGRRLQDAGAIGVAPGHGSPQIPSGDGDPPGLTIPVSRYGQRCVTPTHDRPTGGLRSRSARIARAPGAPCGSST